MMRQMSFGRSLPSASDEVYGRLENTVRDSIPLATEVARDNSVEAKKLFRSLAGPNMITVVGQLDHHASAKPNQVFIPWLNKHGNESSLTFKVFRDKGVAEASWLRHQKKIAKGDRVVLCHASTGVFFVTLMACLYIGAVPARV